MRYQRCKSFDEGHCYNMGKRNGLNTLACEGYDRCTSYETEQPLNGSDKTHHGDDSTQPESSDKGHELPHTESIGQHITSQPTVSRIDIIGQNGNTGESYMSNNPVECEVCGHTLQFDGDSYYCENCLGDKKKEREPYYKDMSMSTPKTEAKEFHDVYTIRNPTPCSTDPWTPEADDEEEDVVNEPAHYKIAGVEVIDVIRAALTENAFAGYLMGNVLKYRLRAGKKGDAEQDIAKALKYEAWLND